MKSILQQIDRTCAKIMAVAFVGIHVPMVALILFGIFNGFAGLGTLILAILVATLVSTLGSIAIIYSIYRETNTAAVAA